MRLSLKLPLAALAIAGLSLPALQATVVFATPNVSTGFVDSSGTLNNGFAYTGSLSPNTLIRSAIFVFELPTLPAGETIDSAEFSAYLFQNAVLDVNADVYALRVSDSNAKLVADYYTGPDDTANTLITTDLVTPSSAIDTTYSTGGSVELGSWLADQYTGETPNSTYAFLRINVDDVPSSTYDLYRFYDEAGATPPVLHINTVPEPQTYAMLAGFAVMTLVVVRRRSRS